MLIIFYLFVVFLNVATNKLYACVVSRDDHYVHKNGGVFDADELEQHPEKYSSMFSHKASVLLLLLVFVGALLFQ